MSNPSYTTDNSRLLSVLGGVAGVGVTALAAARLCAPLPEAAYFAMPTLNSAVGGALSGALFGFSIWALWKPRERIPKAAVILVTLNCAAWSLFLVAHAQLSDGGASIRDHRARLDRDASFGWPNGITVMSHPSSLLAGRVNACFRLSEKPLGLLAGPAIVFVHDQIVPARYWQTGATFAEL